MFLIIFKNYKSYKMTIPQRSLHISDLDHWVDQQTLSKTFFDLGYGSFITRIKMGKDKLTDQPANYAFLEFSTRSKAEEVMERLNNTLIPHSTKTFKLKWAATSNSKEQDGHRNPNEIQIYVSGFDVSTTQTVLMQFFKVKYPSVCFARLQLDPITKLPKGYGFVHFGSLEESQRAVAEQNGKFFNGKKIKVSFADKNNQNKVKVEAQTGQVMPVELPEDTKSLSFSQKQQLYDYYITLINEPTVRLEYERQLQQLYGIDPKQLKKKTLKNDLDIIPTLEYSETLAQEQYIYNLPKMEIYRDKSSVQQYILK